MIGITILIVLLLISFCLLVGLFSKSYKDQRIRLTNLLEADVLAKIENIKTYGQEENGWKNNFPSVLGWDRTTLRVNRDLILVTGKSYFPFIFKSELQPFVLATDIDTVKKRLNFDRVYKPVNIRVTNFGDNLELTIKPTGLLGGIRVHLTFENVGKSNLKSILEIINWR